MSKITSMTAATTPLANDDLFEIVQDTGGTPVNRKISKADLEAEIGGGGGGGAGGGALVPLQEVILTSAAADIDLTSIDQSYRHLLLYAMVRGTDSTTGQVLWCEFNGDTGTNYRRQRLRGTGTSSSGQHLSGNAIALGTYTGASAPAGEAGYHTVEIPFYNLTTFNKMVQAHVGDRRGTGTSDTQVDPTAGWWLNTAAITRIRLYPNAGDFVAGSAVTLYGIEGL
jgi:hypothetical protein